MITGLIIEIQLKLLLFPQTMNTEITYRMFYLKVYNSANFKMMFPLKLAMGNLTSIELNITFDIKIKIE